MQDKKGNINVILTGFTSFFTDISSEMIYPLLQAFISTILSAHKILLGPILGIIEGIAESTASLLKVISGYYSDRIKKRKNLAIFGYTTSAFAKILFLFGAFGWFFILSGRLFDRVGKGIRTAPRDALISESTEKNKQGKAFGLQRGMDFAGATIGVIICFFLVLFFLDPVTKTLKGLNSFYLIFFISVIPAFIGVIFLFFIKENIVKIKNEKQKPKPNLQFWKYDKNLRIFFIAQFLFTLGNSSNQFLLLKSMNTGWSLSSVILMYFLFNLLSSLLSVPFGGLSDKIGRKKLLISGYVLYGLLYIAFGFINEAAGYLLWIFWPVYGVYYAMTEGVEKAFVSDIAPIESKATALGFYHTIVGIGLLPASIIAGVLYSIMPSLPFITGGGLALITVLILGIFVKEKKVA